MAATKRQRKVFERQGIEDAFDTSPYKAYDPEVHGSPSSVKYLGSGMQGGKGIGLSYLAHKHENEGVLSGHGVEIRIPNTWIIRTSHFNEFMEKNFQTWDAKSGKLSEDEVKKRFAVARLPEGLRRDLKKMLKQNRMPLIMRSSSIHEDGLFSFAGKFDSIFFNNRGGLEKRLASAEEAIKQVYASLYSENARVYRKDMGLDKAEEEDKMAIVLQEAVGTRHGEHFYPLFAGVMFTKNRDKRFSPQISPDDPLVRQVVGLGTSAVDSGRFAREFSLTKPEITPQKTIFDKARNAQESADVLNLRSNKIERVPVKELYEKNPDLREFISTLPGGTIRGDSSFRDAPILIQDGDHLFVTFNSHIQNNRVYYNALKSVAAAIEKANGIPSDIEFALRRERTKGGKAKDVLYILQNRFLGVRPQHQPFEIPPHTKKQELVSTNTAVGHGIAKANNVVFVDPEEFRSANPAELVAEINRINKTLGDRHEKAVFLFPGRMGSSDPQLGVQVDYKDVNNAAATVEIGRGERAEDLALASHLYNSLIIEKQGLALGMGSGSDEILKIRQWMAGKRNLSKHPAVTYVHAAKPLLVYVDSRKSVGKIVAPKQEISRKK